MNPNSPLTPEDRVQRGIDALQRDAAGRGPSERIIADTLAVLRRAESQNESSTSRSWTAHGIWQRVIDMTMTQKMAVAASATLVGLTLYFFLSLMHGFASVSYADVVQHLKADTLVCDLTEHLPGKPAVRFKLYSIAPGLTRTDIPGGISTIIDSDSGKSLMLDNQHKTAQIYSVRSAKGPDDHGHAAPNEGADVARSLRSLAETNGEAAEVKQIGTVKAKGFRITQGGLTGMLYADPTSGEPVEIDLQLPQMDVTGVFDHFQFGQKLDPALFSMTPPAGYQLTSTTLPALNPDVLENVQVVLQAYAQGSKGKFPKSLFDWADLSQLILHSPAAGDDPQHLKEITSEGAITAQLSSLKRGTQWDYLPDGAAYGDRAKIVFWVQPRGQEAYKALFGDLHIETVKREQLPAAQNK